MYCAALSTRGLAFPGLALALLVCACATGDPQREARVFEALAGEWESEAEAPDRSGWRRALSTLDNASAPQPVRLTLRAGGSFEAQYEPKDHRVLQRIIGGDELANPISGQMRVRLDWNGTPWIRFVPGAPERRLTLQRGKLILHAVDPQWSNEHYRRSSR